MCPGDNRPLSIVTDDLRPILDRSAAQEHAVGIPLRDSGAVDSLAVDITLRRPQIDPRHKSAIDLIRGDGWKQLSSRSGADLRAVAGPQNRPVPVHALGEDVVIGGVPPIV